MAAETSASRKQNQDRLLRLRRALGFSQRELARELKVTGGAVALWEQGERAVPGPVLALIEAYERHLFPRVPSDHGAAELERLSAEWAASLAASTSRMDPKAALRKSLAKSLSSYLSHRLSEDPLKRTVQISAYSRLIAEVGRSNGLPMKILQLASHLDPEIPEELRRGLEELQSINAAMPVGLAARMVFDELGKHPRELFASWSSRPVASASIGQVHRARLHSGEWVAVKIQHPGIEQDLESALENSALRDILSTLLQSDSKRAMDEFGARVREECDYLREAETQDRFRAHFANDPQIRIPRVFFQYSTKRVLTTEFVEGASLDAFARTASQEERNLAAQTVTRFQAQASSQLNALHADIQPANLIFAGGQVAFVDFGRVVHFAPKDLKALSRLLAAILKDDQGAALEVVKEMGIVKDWATFDFEELWVILREQHSHFLVDAPYEFTPAIRARRSQLMRGFRQKKNFEMSATFFWNLFVISTNDSIRARLQARCNWHQLIKKAYP